MQRRKNHIDRVFYEKLKNFSASPPAETWDVINESLRSDRQKKRVIWIIRVAASIAIIAALSTSYFLVRNFQEFSNIAETDTLGKSSTGTENKVLTEEDKQVQQIENEGVAVDTKMAGRKIMKESLNQALKSEKLAFSQEYGEPVDMIHAGGEESLTTQKTTFYLAGLTPNYIDHVEYDNSRNIDPNTLIFIPYPVTEKPEPVDLSNGTGLEDLYYLPDEELPALSKWAIGTKVSPIYSYRNLGIKESATASYGNYDQLESGLVAYSGGVDATYIPSKRLSVQSGIYYSKMGLSVDHDYFRDNVASPEMAASTMKFYSVANSSGVIEPDNGRGADYVTNWDEYSTQTDNRITFNELYMTVYQGEIIQNFEYLEIPMVLRYRLIDRKMGFNLLGGLSTNVLVGSNVFFKENDNKQKIGKSSNLKTLNYTSIMGLGLDYSITEHLNINLEPTFHYYLNSINESAAIKSHPYSMGVFTGITYFF